MWSLLGAVVWWLSVVAAYHVAEERGRGPWRWVLAAAFVPVLAVLVVWALPSRRVEA